MPDWGFALSIERTGRRALVRVDGELDLATTPKVARAVEGLAAEAADIVVQLEGVWLVDTVALRRLLRARDRVDALGGRLTIAGASPRAAQIIRLAGLGDVLTAEDAAG